MANTSKRTEGYQSAATDRRSVDELASRALAMVAKRNSKPEPEFNSELAGRLCDAAAGKIPESVDDIVTEMKDAGIAVEFIADFYIPYAAREMGDAWCEDTMSFATVTIGTARLQSALRALGSNWYAADYSDPKEDNSSVVIIVVRDSYHTLGAVVLAGQLRRMGLSVRLALGAGPSEIQALFKKYSFDAAMISAQETTGLESLKEIVDVIRQSAKVCPPIVVGGSVLELRDDVKALTGADYATNDPLEALEQCGLTNLSGQKQALTQHRT